jgi:CheY-like chemotaxis protein
MHSANNGNGRTFVPVEGARMRTSIEHIMMLDDEDDHHFLTRLMLKKAGWEGRFSSFTNAEAAVDYLNAANDPPDLLLVDINMPVANGFDFLAMCEKNHLLPSLHTTVIMCSSSNRPVDIHQASRSKSVSGYVEKPLAVEHFERIAWQHSERLRTATSSDTDLPSSPAHEKDPDRRG